MITGILQARMSSSRLPGKVMFNVCGKPILEHILTRISKSQILDKIIVATSINSIDDQIENITKKLGFNCVRGSEDDVLSRFELAARISKAKTVVRMCADSPILDSNVVDSIVNVYESNQYDYVNNMIPIPRTYPDGLAVEVFSYDLLYEAHINARKPSEREHVTPYIWLNPEKYSIHRVDYSQDFSKYRFNLDYKEDFEFIKKIFENLYLKNQNFSLEDTIDFLSTHQEITKINSHIKQNQGWLKSLDDDKKFGFL